jgi:hypothetical protein
VCCRITWRTRSVFFRRLANQHNLAFSEAKYPFWKFISVDPVIRDAPFIWRSLTDTINGHTVTVRDMQSQGALPHPWWYRGIGSDLRFFGISSETTLSIDGVQRIIKPTWSPVFYNRFATQGQIESALEQVTQRRVTS